MSGELQRRYPSHLFTRQHLEPIEAHRATILDRDEHTCAAAGVALTGRYWHGVLPCSHTLQVVSAGPTEHPAPLYLRTFCLSHLALALPRSPQLAATWVANGWRIPDHVDVVDAYAGLLPVRAGDRWWQLDDWGERRPLTDEQAAQRRAELDAWFPA